MPLVEGHDNHEHHQAGPNSLCLCVVGPNSPRAPESHDDDAWDLRQTNSSKRRPSRQTASKNNNQSICRNQIGTCQMLFIISFILSVMGRKRQITSIFPRSINETSTTAHDKAALVSIGEQLAELRQRLLLQSRDSAQAEQVALNSPCLSSISCQQRIVNSHCELSNFTCACLPQHVQFNSTLCLPPSLLGFECQLDAQCQQKVANSVCLNNKCACTETFVAYRRDKCLSASKLNEFCLTDSQCRLNDKHSHCKWKIPNVYGQCKCPINYKLITQTGKQVVCAPRLGDVCLTNAECLLATKNTVCKKDASPITWATSGASSDRCQCASGFRASPNRLECLALDNDNANDNADNKGNSSSLTNAKHHYDLLPVGQQQPVVETGKDSHSHAGHNDDNELDIKMLDANKTPRNRITTTTTAATTTTTTTGRPAQAETTTAASQMTSTITITSNGKSNGQQADIYTNQTTATTTSGQAASNKDNKSKGEPKMSSLGKACSSSRQCQLRDPNSYCSSAGVCDCLLASPRCSANATGCHKDTFQCNNGQCISWYFVCDHFRNCDDGSDEDLCLPNKCPPEAFQCLAGGACITRGKLCNGHRDCPDGSDELQCGRVTGTSPATDLMEQQQQQFGANGTSPGCHPGAFRCQNGQCLPAYVFCNAVEDCLDGSDETDTLCERSRRKSPDRPPTGTSSRPAAAATTSTPKATSDTNPAMNNQAGEPKESPLVKTDRAAIERLLASLALASRTPESRGRPLAAAAAGRRASGRRARLLSSPMGECPLDSFTCRNGKCRSSAILCSGVDGCGDNSDEDRCEVCQCPAPIKT